MTMLQKKKWYYLRPCVSFQWPNSPASTVRVRQGSSKKARKEMVKTSAFVIHTNMCTNGSKNKTIWVATACWDEMCRCLLWALWLQNNCWRWYTQVTIWGKSCGVWAVPRTRPLIHKMSRNCIPCWKWWVWKCHGALPHHFVMTIQTAYGPSEKCM